MLPGNAISAIAQPGSFLAPDDVDIGVTESFEYGGVALNDASQGRLVKVWRAYADNDAREIHCAPLVAGVPDTTLLTGLGIVSAVSLAFDSNMNPTLAFIESGTMRLWWYNSVTHAYQIDNFPGVTSGKVCTDDKRKALEGPSDVIFAYTLDGFLYWRQQRDRYTIERTAGPSGVLILNRLGMSDRNRLQFELREPSE